MRSRTCADELPARCPQVGRNEVIGNGGPRQMVVVPVRWGTESGLQTDSPPNGPLTRGNTYSAHRHLSHGSVTALRRPTRLSSTFGLWPVVCCVAGSLRKGPIPVDRRSVAESHCDDDQLIVADLGNHSPVADPVSPVLAQVAAEALPAAAGRRADRLLRGMPSTDAVPHGQGDGQPYRTAGTSATASASNAQLIPQVLRRMALPVGLLPLAHDRIRPKPIFQIAEVLVDRFSNVKVLDRPVRRANHRRSSSSGVSLIDSAIAITSSEIQVSPGVRYRASLNSQPPGDRLRAAQAPFW